MPTPSTEIPHPEHPRLDEYATHALVDAFLHDQSLAARAVQAAAGRLAEAVDAAVPRLEAGGRLVYVGAGTSGRLGLLDSVELNPTFSWPPERAVALLAGGPRAVHEAVEGAEDDADGGAADVRAAQDGQSDVVLLIAASGATPYVMGAMRAARTAGALCRPDLHKVMFVQIAGLIARRIVTYPEIGARLERGRRYGLIRFGSRVDVYLPPGSTIKVRLGDHTKAGESVLGELP